jgi:hypothetical protein
MGIRRMLSSAEVKKLAITADEFLINHNHQEIKKLFDGFNVVDHVFECAADESRFYYILGNCAQELFRNDNLDWFSDDLSRAVIFFRKALYAFQKIDNPNDDDLYLKSCIEVNLGNCLSCQGRAFCCIPLWDSAFQLKKNPVAIISKANHSLFLADILYDDSHKEYHLFSAYKLINLGLESFDELHFEHKAAYSESSNFMAFKAWFEDKFKLDDFECFETYKEDFKTRKQADYLKWCGDNRLFINDLNDVCLSEVVYQDILELPSFSQSINQALSMHEELMYHGNFDELKNDYCYARYLVFSAKDIPNENEHFFNETYPHVNDMAHSVTNLKASHYKSAFKILYAIFDKVAYFISRFFDLNDVADDRNISFDNIFRDLSVKDKNKWLPNKKLKNSGNCFIHALFYILKDIRDVKTHTPISKWLDPDAKKFTDIRNAIEHRSFKIVDDYGYELISSGEDYRLEQLRIIESKVKFYEIKIEELSIQIDSEIDGMIISELEADRKKLEENLKMSNLKIHEKIKLSSHSLIVKESDFESRLMTLMKLARNSIMYLALAIQVEEQNKPDDGVLMMSREVPLK